MYLRPGDLKSRAFLRGGPAWTNAGRITTNNRIISSSPGCCGWGSFFLVASQARGGLPRISWTR